MKTASPLPASPKAATATIPAKAIATRWDDLDGPRVVGCARSSAAAQSKAAELEDTRSHAGQADALGSIRAEGQHHGA